MICRAGCGLIQPLLSKACSSSRLLSPAALASPKVFRQGRRFAGSPQQLRQQQLARPQRSFQSRRITAMGPHEGLVQSKPEGLLEGHLALITGSSTGIGAAIAVAFARQGAKLVITAEPEQQENLDKVAAQCREEGAEHVDIIPADLSDTKNADTLAKTVLDKYGYVSVYVQCAGAYGPMSLEKGPNKGQGPLDGDPAEWDRLTMINQLSPMHITRWLTPPMVEKGDGYIITIASIEALSPYPSAPAYSASKWGLRGWNKAVYAALKTEGVKAYTINPAQVDTSMTRDRPDQEMIPDLEITPEDIAEAALLPFRMSKNVVLEEIIVHTAATPKKPKK